MMQVHRNAAAKSPQRESRPRSGRVEVVRIDRRVMKKALQIAKGDATRLSIRPDGSVVVR